MIKTVKTKVFGKINIGLNVLGRCGDHHDLDTVVANIDLCDVVTVRTRNDRKVNLISQGGFSAHEIAETDNNAYKAALAFMEKFDTFGADIKLTKNIPVGSGLGGSSADIVGVVKGMMKAYNVSEDVLPLVNSLCSDGEFLCGGGFARLRGKGSVAERFSAQRPYYFVIAVPESVSNTSEVFAEFDRGEYPSTGADTAGIIRAIKEGGELKGEIFNALKAPACSLNKEISAVYEALLSLNPSFISMSGSGSAVYGGYESLELCLWAKDKMKRYCENVFVKQTL
ncbi:MAG: hypothetical protein IJU84_04755 [Clostridia bacterium]|nr:hypothetical protein [Clostridia bacterium]